MCNCLVSQYSTRTRSYLDILGVQFHAIASLSRADYWKSQGRKFCDFCKCWIADNKPSIEFHEGGKKHKENVSKRLKEIHKNSAKQAKQHRKFENDLKKMENAGMAAYLKDVENNMTDITAERIIREKLENGGKKDTAATSASTPVPQLPPPETNPRYGNREFHPVGGDAKNKGGRGNRGNRDGTYRIPEPDPCDPMSASRPRSSSGPGKSGYPGAEGAGDPRPQGKAKGVKGKKGGRKGTEDEGPQGNKSERIPLTQKLWYEALSAEGYTYYWHVETNESVWEPPPEGYASIAEQEEEVKELALQEELMAEIAKEEERKREETADERRANAEREKQKELRKQREQEEAGANQDQEDEQPLNPAPYRRDYSVPERPQPYGTWKTVQVIHKKPVDLQLPKQHTTPIPVPTKDREIPVRVFKEKTISKALIDDDDSDEETAPSTFKKRKFGNKNVRKRLNDD